MAPTVFKAGSRMGMFSPDGRSKMFDESADGYGRGEGIGVVCLKPLDLALQDGDFVECVIRQTGTNHDGHARTLTAPSAKAQAQLIRKTYQDAGLDLSFPSSRPQYFEAHGTCHRSVHMK
jgi:acyl transferase domain-containing protein